MNCRVIVYIFALMALLSRAESAEITSRIQRLPSLAQSESWEVPVDSRDALRVEQWPESIATHLTFGNSGRVRLMLKNPLPVPEWADGFSFIVGDDGRAPDIGVSIRFLVKDSADQEFYFYARSPLFTGQARNCYYPSQSPGRPIRVDISAFKVPRMETNFEAIGKSQSPRPPYRIISLQLDRLNEKPTGPMVLYFQDFACTRLSPIGTSLHFALNGRQSFFEFDPLPSVALGELGPVYGDELSVSWEIRDRYDGRPFLVGGEHFSLNPKDPQYPLVLSKKIEFPFREKGAYWVHVKRKCSQAPSSEPLRIDEWDFRLDIFQGEEAKKHDPIIAAKPIPESLIRIAPDRESVVFGVDEPFTVEVAYKNPGINDRGFSSHVRLLATNGTEVLRSIETPLAELPNTVKLDFSEIPPGSYRLCAELLAGGKVLDRTERLIGRKGVGSPAFPGSKIFPTGKEMLESSKSLIYVDPHMDEADPARRWNFLKDFLDQAPTVSDKTDLQIRWKDIERLPGVYDWTEVDRFLAYAQEKKLSVLLWPQFFGAEPEWIPAFFEKNRKGDHSVACGGPYLFHGGIINHWHAEPVRAAVLRFVSAVASRYADHPAVHGFYLMTEHPGDRPFVSWYVGGSSETQADFRVFMQRQAPGLTELNARWGTQFTSWSEVGSPPEGASSRYLLDWLICMRESISGLLVDLAKSIRRAAPDSLIMMYTDGLDGPELKELNAMGGCMLADGGSERPESFGCGSMGRAMYGLHRRTEPVAVTKWAWSKTGPSKLDASLFTMLLGGGGNANCKMFLPAGQSFDGARKPPFSLDRFERFIPIWNELRATTVMPREAFILEDRNASLLECGSTKIENGDVWSEMCALEAGVMAPTVPLELAVQGKFIFLPRVAAYETSVTDGLARYVENGGTLLMCADAGRHSPDIPEEDWVLLRRLGFEPPEGNCQPGIAFAAPVKGEIFQENAASFQLRDIWPAPKDAGAAIVATFQKNAQPAVTWKPFGKGRVVIVWANTIVPAMLSKGYPFLRDIARWSGVQSHAESDTPLLWTNLLKHQKKEEFYGLVYHAFNHSQTPKKEANSALSGNIRWVLPEGKYRITELISGEDLGTRPAGELRKVGITAKLEQGEVAIYRMEKAPSGEH